MSLACPTVTDAGVISGVLDTLDCQTRAYAQGGYEALTQGSGMFAAALTALMTIYVAILGWRLLFARGGASLSDAPGIALRIGAILALVTSWSTFQTLVFDLADRAPVEIAALASAPWTGNGGSSLAAQPVAGLEAVYAELSQTAAAFGRVAGPNAKAYAGPEAAAAESVSLASGALFVMSVGVIGGAKLAVGVLSAIGPLFIALALLNVTRGVFVGWLRALVAAALTPMVGWLLLVLLLVVLTPWLETLTQQRLAQQLDPNTALSTAALILVFACGQLALVAAAWAAAMGFRLPARPAATAPAGRAATATASSVSVMTPSRPERLAYDLQRDETRAEIRARSAALAAAAGGVTRETSLVAAASAPRLGDTYRRPSAPARRTGTTR